MYDLLTLYAKPMRPAEPVICVDEKGFQLMDHSRAPLPMSSGRPAKVDGEYVRKGTSNLFQGLLVDPPMVYQRRDQHLVSSFINLAAFDAAGIPDRCVANPRHSGAMAVVCALRSGRQQPLGAHADS